MEISNNYLTFFCSKFPTISWDNWYSKEEEAMGTYIWDEFDKRCNYISDASFMDFRFEFYFRVNKRIFFGKLNGINPGTGKFGLSIQSTLNRWDKFLRITDATEHNYINQVLDDILRLDPTISEITWSNLPQELLNAYEVEPIFGE